MNILFFLTPKSDVAYVYDYHTMRQALEILERHRYSCVPILNREGQYVGSITEGDLLWGIKNKNVLDIHGAEEINIMELDRQFDIQSVTADAAMEDLIEKAMDQNYVPVVDDRNNFIGIITRKDIISYFYDQMKEGKLE